MQPIIRNNHYVEEYKKLVYDMYSRVNTVIWGTYYQLDNTETTYDPNYKGTYHEQGELSGRKFNKIHNMPLLFAKDATPVALSSSESGLNFGDIQTSIVIDSICGLTPHVGDLLSFSISGEYASWKVINVSKSAGFDVVYTMCDIKPFRFREDFSEYNINKEFMYVEYAKQIYYLNDGINYSKGLTRLNNVISFLNDPANYNDNISYHIAASRQCFPQFETILSAHDTIAPPVKIYLGENFNVDIPKNSILMLWCMFQEYDNSKPLIRRINKSNRSMVKNPKVLLWDKYNEWLLQYDGTTVLGAIFYSDLTNFDNATQFLLDNIESVEYNEYENPTSSIEKLADEILKFKFGMIEEYSEIQLSTNLLEAVIEYCQILKELLIVEQRSVILS